MRPVHVLTSAERTVSLHRFPGDLTEEGTNKPGFYKGPAGSQVTLSSLGNQTRALLDDQARHLLTEQERATMMYYLDQYRGGAVSVEALVMALFELLNTHAKVTWGFCPHPVNKDLSSAERWVDTGVRQPRPPNSVFWGQGQSSVAIITEYSSQTGSRLMVRA